MNIFTHHMLNPEALCHRKMQSAEYFIFRYSYKGEKSVMNHQHVVEENGTAAILYICYMFNNIYLISVFSPLSISLTEPLKISAQ